MDEPELDPHIAFGRQRRNFLGASLVLLGFQWAGATFSKLTILGNTIDLRASLDITTPLWVAWAYLGLRTYQYFRALPGQPLVAPFKDRVNVEAVRIAKRIAAHALRHTIEPELKAPAKVTLELRQESIVGYYPTYWQFELRGSASTHETRGPPRGVMQLLDPYTVRMPTNRLPECRLRAAWFLTAHTPLVTEYILPVVVGALPVIKWALGWLRHSLAT